MLQPLRHSHVLTLTMLYCTSSLAQVDAHKKTQQISQKYEQSIGDIGKKIEDISRNLNANKALVSGQRDALLEAEQKIYKLKHSLQKTEYDLAKSQHEFDALSLQIAVVKRSQVSNRDALKGLLKSRYYNGKPDFLKKLLNQENPYAVGRLTNYNNYFSSALKMRFAGLRLQAVELEKLNHGLNQTIETLKKERERQKREEKSIQESKIARARVIEKLDQKIANNAQLLAALTSDRKRLMSLLNQLKVQAAELKRLDELKAKQEAEQRQLKDRGGGKPVDSKKYKPLKGGFLKQKGRLSYPVTGNLVRSFGSRLPGSGMRSEGSFFTTKGSVSVKSIFRGRVLFADFLKGYGLLIIVDHGDDHISLYGHNDRLVKKVGDRVESNEEIAKSGVTGGLKSHGLYFEIRDNATPIDAAKWCR